MEPFPANCSQDDRAPEKRKVDRSILSLTMTTTWEAFPQPSHLRKRAKKYADSRPALGRRRSNHSAAGKQPGFPRRHCQLTRRLIGRLSATLSGRVAAEFCRHRLHLHHLGPSAHVLDRPPAQLHDVVAAHVHLGARLVSSVPEAARRSLTAAVSESSLLAGRIEFFDLQDPAKGQASLVIALQAAQDAQDPLLGSAVLAHMAFIPVFSRNRKRAEEARDKIPAARAFARRGPASPEMLAWLDAVEAEVETRLGHAESPPDHPPRRRHLRHRRTTSVPVMAGLVLANTAGRIQEKHAADREATRTRA